jgi:hypothetical protein
MDTLNERLELLQSYSSKEQELIEEQITTFRNDLKRAKQANANNSDGTVNVDAAMARLMIAAKDMKTEETIGKGS